MGLVIGRYIGLWRYWSLVNLIMELYRIVWTLYLVYLSVCLSLQALHPADWIQWR